MENAGVTAMTFYIFYTNSEYYRIHVIELIPGNMALYCKEHSLQSGTFFVSHKMTMRSVYNYICYLSSYTSRETML